MRRKLGIILMIAILTGVVIGSQRLGEYLYEQTDVENEIATAGDTAEMVVVVDSGHGGSDPGKVGINGAIEKDVNLKIAIKLKSLLEEQGIKVIMTREDENGLADSKVEDLKKRVSIINQEKPLLAVSIHQNSYSDPAVKGPQVFFYEDSEKGKRLALVIQEKMNQQLEIQRPRAAKGNRTYYLLKRSEGVINIVECGFLTNPDEAGLLQKDDYQQKVALAIADGIDEYLASEKNEKN